MHSPATTPMDESYRRFVIADSPLLPCENGARSLHGRVIMHGVWPLHSADLMVGMFRRYNIHTLSKNYERNIRREISIISGQELQRVNSSCYRSCTECIRSVGRHSALLVALSNGYIIHYPANLLLAAIDCKPPETRRRT